MIVKGKPANVTANQKTLHVTRIGLFWSPPICLTLFWAKTFTWTQLPKSHQVDYSKNLTGLVDKPSLIGSGYMLYSFASFCIIIEIRIENHKPYVQIKVNFFFFLIYAHSQDLGPPKKKE